MQVTVLYRVAKKSRVEVDVYFFDVDGNTVGKGFVNLVRSGKTKKFVKASEAFEIPDKAAGIGMNIKMTAPGTVWIDGVEVTCEVKDAAPGSLANGGFVGGDPGVAAGVSK